MVDPLIDASLDLLAEPFWRWLLELAQTGRVRAAFAMPPCSTWSAARRRPLPGGGGPRPLRDRESPWCPLPGRSERERRACDIGTMLMLRCLAFLGTVWSEGGWIGMEHPRDFGAPVPSVWASAPLRALVAHSGAILHHVDQCEFGAVARKPTTLLLDVPCLVPELAVQCRHRGHPPAIGRSSQGGFKTTALARYPQRFAQAIARVAAGGFMADGRSRPVGSAAWDALWTARQFPALYAKACESSPLCPGVDPIQK